MKNVTIRQLRIFSEAARRLSFTETANALHLTPPAVSIQIKELESQVGLPLFERNGRKIQLTTVGKYVLHYTSRILADLKDAEDAVAKLRQLEAGQLVIGMVSTAQYFLPMLLTQFRQQHPGVDIRLAVGNRAQLVSLLQAGEVDIAIMGRPPKDMATRAEPFAAQPHVFVAPLKHPLCDLDTINAEQLAKHPFIMREIGSGTRASLEKFCESQRLHPHVVMEMSSNETIKQAVMAGMGLSFLSLHTIGLELRHKLIAVLNVAGTPITRDWNCVHTLSRVLSPAAEAFRHFMLEQGETLLKKSFGNLLPTLQTATPAQTNGTLRKKRQAGKKPSIDK